MSGRVEHVDLVAGPWRLRPPLGSDAERALTMLTDPAVVRFNPARDVTDLETARAWIERGADWDSGDHRTWNVVDADDAMIGNVSVTDIDSTHLSAMVGYRVHPEHRGRGVATAAVRAASRYAIEGLQIERITLLHVIANPASCAVAERSGYVLEGVMREEYRLPDGSRWDSHLHSLLPKDLI